MLPRYVDEYVNKLINFIKDYDIDDLVIDDLDIDDYNYQYFIDKFTEDVIDFEKNKEGHYKFMLDQFQTMNTIKFMIAYYGYQFCEINDNLLQNYFLLYLYNEDSYFNDLIEDAIQNKIEYIKK